ncbi:restriction endonuclease [Streptomyces sp. H39-C1]|uniref:restriction endonuclease n=1 Tax=Streptomyces sp. H39-C1 TaxID=3004355 RepID=UPI0022B05382|nr:restriction endonuclease [Streptomyces sp. H39-C1]MCZ4103319.1 restriction endonuclease [Streptomyces sp. H39-C1]
MELLLVLVGLVAVGAVVVLVGRARVGRGEARAEQLRLAEQARLDARRTMESVLAMNDREFEEYVADLCRRDGCTDVVRVGGAGDLGADVIASLPDGRKLVIQCKRYAPHRSVGSRDIQTFNGTARAEHHADIPVFVATCPFTKPGRDFAAKHALVLIDLDLLGFWNTGSPLTSFFALDITRSGTHKRPQPKSAPKRPARRLPPTRPDTAI